MPSHQFQEEVQTYQIDFSRHVNNGIYIQWLEKARVRLCTAAGYPVTRLAEEGFLPVLTETQITYKKPLYLGDVATIEAWVTEISGASAWIDYEIRNQNGEVCAQARQRGLFVSMESQRPMRITGEMREKFELFTKEG